MYKRIDKNDEIFSSNGYLRDKTRFHVIKKNFKSDELVLYSDGVNYVVCRGKVGWPTWIWTKDKIDVSLLPEIEEVIRLYLTDNDTGKFTCKKELYDLLVKDNFKELNLDDYFEMGSLCCKETKKPRECDGHMALATSNDYNTLVDYWYKDNHEMNGVDNITLEQAKEEVKEMIESGTFYTWKNNDNTIVCMVLYKVSDDEAVLNHVYTPPEERGKGYAANLIYTITNKLLDKGLIPLLYTDYNYPPSNKAYINAGYIDTRILINFSCSKRKKKVK